MHIESAVEAMHKEKYPNVLSVLYDMTFGGSITVKTTVNIFILEFLLHNNIFKDTLCTVHVHPFQQSYQIPTDEYELKFIALLSPVNES